MGYGDIGMPGFLGNKGVPGDSGDGLEARPLDRLADARLDTRLFEESMHDIDECLDLDGGGERVGLAGGGERPGHVDYLGLVGYHLGYLGHALAYFGAREGRDARAGDEGGRPDVYREDIDDISLLGFEDARDASDLAARCPRAETIVVPLAEAVEHARAMRIPLLLFEAPGGEPRENGIFGGGPPRRASLHGTWGRGDDI